MSFIGKLYRSYLSLCQSVYSRYVSRHLGSVGKGSVICRHCRIYGGGENNIHIGDNTLISERCIIESWSRWGDQTFNPEIIIGNDCKIGEYSHISACTKIVLGDGLLTGRFVLITDNSHGGMDEEFSGIRPIKRPLKVKGDIIIGKNVWIGDKATICSGVTIGDNVIIAANSVVTSDIPPNSMAAGVKKKKKKSLE